MTGTLPEKQWKHQRKKIYTSIHGKTEYAQRMTVKLYCKQILRTLEKFYTKFVWQVYKAWI